MAAPHVPSMALFLLVVLQSIVGSASAPPGPMQNELEGTYLDMNFVTSFPGIMEPEQLVADVLDQLSEIGPFEHLRGPLVQKLVREDVCRLQAYWVDSQVRGRSGYEQGPDWAAQVRKGALAASLGYQRHPGNSKRGLDHLLPPCLAPPPT